MRTLGASGLQISALGFGALEIGRDWAADVEPQPHHLSASEAERVLNHVLDKGINFIDTAPAYWFSEEYIGAAIAHRRDEYVLATKVGEHCDWEGSFYDYSSAATTAFIDRSLTRLRTDHIDLIQIHSASVDVLEKGETWTALDAARSAGKVRFIGMTGNVEAAIRAVEIGGYDSVQVPYNLLAPEASERLFPLCQAQNVGVIIMRGLAGGKLTAKYQNLADENLKSQIAGIEAAALNLYPESQRPLSRLALRFILAQNAVSTAIIGTRRAEALDQNLEDLVGNITEAEEEAFKRIVSSR